LGQEDFTPIDRRGVLLLINQERLCNFFPVKVWPSVGLALGRSKLSEVETLLDLTEANVDTLLLVVAES
jgi:hypothetical protein